MTATGTSSVRAALPGLMVVMFLASLDQTVMAAALPTIAGDLHGTDQMPAVITGYLAAATVAMPLTGKLGDAFGRKRILQGSLSIFLLGAALCSVAGSIAELVAFRAIQGVGGGGLMIGAQAVIGEIVSPRERGRLLGLIGGAYVVAVVAGPLAGGILVDRLSWRWIFYLYLPLAGIALAVVTASLRLPRPSSRRPVDYPGAACLSAAVVGLVLVCGRGLDGGPAWLLPGTMSAAVLAGVAWLVLARRAEDPIIPLRLFRDAGFTLPGAVSFLVGFAMFATVSFLPAFLQVGAGVSATTSSLMLIALMAGVLVAAIGSGRMITRTGRYKVYPVAGCALAAAGMGLFAGTGSVAGPAILTTAMVLLGLGIGLVNQVMVLVVQNTVGYAELGTATGTVTFLRQIGSSVGVALIGSLAAGSFASLLPPDARAALGTRIDSLTPAQLASLPESLRSSVATAFRQALPPIYWYATALLAVAFVLTLCLPARELRTTAHAGENPGSSEGSIQ